MALSPADFAAYSRATGAPYPEDPEERAQMAPEVLEFRRNQLRAPGQESPLPGILGAAAVGLGALTGGMALARALRGNKGQAAASTAYNIPRKAEQDIRTVATPVRQRVAEDVERQARTERPTGTVLTDLVNYRFQQGLADIPEPTKQELANITKKQFDRFYDEATKLPLPRTTTDPSTGRSIVLDPFGIDPSSRQAVYASVAAKPESQLPRVYKPQSNIKVDLITDPNTGEIFRRGKSPENFAQTYKPLPPGDPWTGEAGASTPLIQGPISAQQALQDFLGEATLPYPRTDLPTTLANRTPGSFREFSRDVSGATAAERLIQDPELKQLVTQQRREEGAELGREAQRQMRVASAIESEADQYIAQLRQESLSQQVLGALESGEDQMTGRTMRAVQRNEDLDVSEVNQIARQTGSADVAASMTPDGVPVDQVESVGIDLGQSSASRFLQQRRLELLSDPTASTSTRLENKLAEAFGPEAWREDPKATRRRNALKLGAAGNEQFFENINEGTFTVGGEQFPVSLLKEGVFMEETAQNLLDRTNKYRDWLGNIRLEETQKQIRLGAELEALDKQDIGLMNNIQQISAALEQKPASFKTPQERERYLQLKRDLQGSLERQDEIDIQINQIMREFELSENRLAGAERATTRNLRRAAVPQKLASGIEEGIVVRPVLTAPDNIALAEGELSNLERGRPVGEFISQEQLEVVPGGLLSGGRAKSVVNIGGDLGIDPDTGERILLPNVDVNTGEMLVQKLAGKRMGADPDTGEATINVRGRGGVAGLDTKASIGIYGPELGEYGTSAMTKEGTYTEQATRPPTATETSVPVHKIRTYKKGDEGEDIPVYFNYPSSYEDPQAYKYTEQPTAQSIESFDVARQLRQLQQSGRPGEAQAFLDKIMKQRGISGTSGAFSRIR